MEPASKLRKTLLVAFIILLGGNTSYGATRYVDPSSAGVCGGNAPCYVTINGAMDASEAGDEIVLMAGTHMGGNGKGGSIIPRKISCNGGTGMDNLMIRGYKTNGDTGDWQPENVIVEFGDNSENYGFGLTTRNTNAMCVSWWEQNHGHAANGWKIRGITFQEAKDYPGIMTGIYIAGQGETAHSNEKYYDAGSQNIQVINCIIRGFDLGIDVAHRTYEVESPAVSARIRNNKFYPDLVRYAVNGGDDKFYPKGHSFGAIRAQVNTKVIIRKNVITIETPKGYNSLPDYIGEFAVMNPKAALIKGMPQKGIVLEGGEKGSANVVNNLVEYHNVGILSNGRRTNSKIGSSYSESPNIIRHNYIGIGNGPQTCVNIIGNIIGDSTGSNKVGIMDVGAFSTIRNNTINVVPTVWDAGSPNNIGVFSIDSHYNYNYEHKSGIDEFRPDMPEAQDVESFGGMGVDKNNIFAAAGMTGLSFYGYGTVGLPPGSGLAPGQSFSLGLDVKAIVANQAFSGMGKKWAPPVELKVGMTEAYRHIQNAINAANPGQVVVVKPGTYNEDIINLLGIHVIAENFINDEDDLDEDGLIDGGDGFPQEGRGGWDDTVVSGSGMTHNKWSDSFDSGILDWNRHGMGTTVWSDVGRVLQADSILGDKGYSILWNAKPRSNKTDLLNFRFNIKDTASKQNAYAVLRYNNNAGKPNFVYFGVEIDPDTNAYRFAIKKGMNGNINETAMNPDCTGVYSAWHTDGYIAANTWHTMSLQLVSPGFFAMEVRDNTYRTWKLVLSHSFSKDKSWASPSDGVGLMVEGSDTDFDNFGWSMGPLVSGHDLNMTGGLNLRDFRHQSGSFGFGSKAVSPLIKGNTIALDSTSGTTSIGIGMSTGAKPAIIGNVIKNTYISMLTSSAYSRYGVTALKEESYYGPGRNTQPYMGGIIPNDIWSGPYVYNNYSSEASSANYRVLPYTYGWVEKNHLKHNVSKNVNSSLINMVQGASKFHGLIQVNFLNNYLSDNMSSGHPDGFGGRGVWTDNQDSNQTYLEAVFDGNFIDNVGVGFWSKRGGRELKILNNRITSNVIGMSLVSNTDAFVINNRIYKSSLFGVWLYGSEAKITAAYNVLEKNYIGLNPGVWNGGVGNRIVNCDIINNIYAGAYSGLGISSRYTRNNFANNPIGLNVLGDGWDVVSNNKFLHNAVAGVKIYGEGAARFRRNTFVAGWNKSLKDYYNPIGLMVVPGNSGIGNNSDITVGNIFFENSLGIALFDKSTSGQVTDNIALRWDKGLDITDFENDGYWYVKEGTPIFENYLEQYHMNPRFMDPDHSDPRIDDYRLDPGASYGIYGAVNRSSLLDVVPTHPDQLSNTGIGVKVDPCYVAVCWVGENGYPDDLGADGIAGTADDYSDIDDVEEYRMTSGDVFSYTGSGNATYHDDLVEYNFDLYGFKDDGGVKGRTGVERYLTKRKYYFKLVDTGAQTMNLDDVQIPYYPKADDGSPININGTFESGGAPDFTGWVELDGNQKGLGRSYIVNAAWSGVSGSYCIGTSGVNGINANDSDKLRTIVFRSLPFRIDLRRETKLKFRIGGDGGFIPLAPNFKYKISPSRPEFLACDINGDGKGDLVNYVIGDESINYIIGVSLAWWDSAADKWDSLLDSNYVLLSVMCSDINGDGKDDIVANVENVGLLWRDSASNTWNPILDSSYILLSTLSADINGDGKDDIVTSIKGTGLVWRDSASNTWNPILDSTYMLMSTLSADINGDGRDDIVANIKGKGLYWWDSVLNTWNPILNSTYVLMSTLSADINGDGKDDIVTEIKGVGLFWRDSATDTWTPILDSSNTLLSVFSSDVNGDGKDDVVTHIKGAGLYWWDSVANTWNPILDSSTTLLSALSSDVNGDGKDDIVANIKGLGVNWIDSATSAWNLILAP